MDEIVDIDKIIRDFFEKLLALKNDQFCVEAPPGEFSLSEFLRLKTGERYILSVERKIDMLARLGYLEKECDPLGVLLRLKITRAEWEPELISKITAWGQKKRLFAILVDYRNLEKSLPSPAHAEILKDFFWLETEINKHGKIAFAMIFIPEYFRELPPPLNQLSNVYRYQLVICLRQKAEGGVTTKDVDTVDWKIDSFTRELIEHSDVTDVVVVSGDADFNDLVVTARRHQKSVIVISTPQALSGRFLDLSGFLDIKFIPSS